MSPTPGFLLTPAHTVHLRTERLVMRRFTRDDVGIIVDLDSDPEVTRYVGMTEPTTPEVVVARALITHGFDVLGDPRIVAHAFRKNRASTRVMEKVGMRYEREEIEDGEPLDWYAITSAAPR